ncbi:MAG: sugar ABC transporter permease [Cyanobacteria bacterium J06648_16]
MMEPDRDRLFAGLLLAPALILLGTFVLGPILYLGYLSLTTGSFTRAGLHWVGGQHYQRLLADPEFWQVVGNTAYFGLATVAPSIVLPLGLAALLDRSVAFQGLLRTAFFLPSVLSVVAVGLGFRWLFQDTGPINHCLQALGLAPVAWLRSPQWAMPVVIVLSVWKQLGFNLVVFLAGLQAIPRSRYEAAALDGANELQRFWHMTLPGLRPTLLFVTVTTTLFTLRSFEQIYILTGGGPLNSTNIWVYYIYDQALAQFEFGRAAAATLLLLLVVLGLVWVQLRLRVGESRSS